MSRTLATFLGPAVALAALSLLLPYEPVYDPWGWLVWGGELADLDLATAAGPSWKPLPVLLDAPLSVLGDAAPEAWLLVARSGWILAPLLAGWLAARLAGDEVGRWRLLAALLAAGSVALAADAFTPPTRQFTGGLSEPLLVALVLGAVAAALAERPRAAIWLGVAAALLRPECWPFLAAFAVWAVRREPGLRIDALAAALLVPVAWFVPDLLAAGDPLEGSETARNGAVELVEVAEVAGRALAAPLAAAWIGVALFLLARGPRDRVLTVLLGGAVAWVAVVGAMAVIGFAGLPRFFSPATAAFSIVGAVGVARAGAAGFAGRSRGLAGAATLAILVAVAGFAVRAAEVPGDLRTVRAQARSLDQLFALAEGVGRERLLACGGRVRVTQLLAQTALAWRLDEPIESVKAIRRPRYGVALSVRPPTGADGSPIGRTIARRGAWRATRLPCPAAQEASGPAMAGVSGATR